MPATRVHKISEQVGPTAFAGVYDALSAKLAQRAGFPLAFVSGYSVAATFLGEPDLGILTQTEMIDHARRFIARSVRDMKALLLDPVLNLARIEDFPMIDRPQVCRRCNFRRLCFPRAETAPAGSPTRSQARERVATTGSRAARDSERGDPPPGIDPPPGLESTRTSAPVREARRGGA